MKDLIIVDGYNFIFYFYSPSGLDSGSLDYLKDKLAADLANFKHRNDCDITLVFDGKKSNYPSHYEKTRDGIRIIHSGSKKTADTVIEKIAASEKSGRKVFVVTSDYSQQKAIFGKNAFRKSCREFSLEMKRSGEQTKEIIKDISRSAVGKFYRIENRLKRSGDKNKPD